ncbi:MAG: 2-phospho-L-lactate transferase [Actinomycetota bacterium]
MIVVLAGGVGAARYLRGVLRVVSPDDVTIIGNTGDDFRIYGVHVSPDLDIVTYTLTGRIDEEKGWGLAGDTTVLLDEMRAAGLNAWFHLGDRDFGVCLARTEMLAAGASLSDATARISERFGLAPRLLPMTDDEVGTRVVLANGEDVHFQEYWVGRKAADPVRSVYLGGADTSRPAPGVVDAIASASAILIAPSNPVVSIGTILAVPGIREALTASSARVVGVSPIVGGAPVRGMADKLMPAAGAPVTAVGAALLLRDVLDGYVIDLVDENLAGDVEALGLDVAVAQTMMRTVEDAAALAKVALTMTEHR